MSKGTSNHAYEVRDFALLQEIERVGYGKRKRKTTKGLKHILAWAELVDGHWVGMVRGEGGEFHRTACWRECQAEALNAACSLARQLRTAQMRRLNHKAYQAAVLNVYPVDELVGDVA